MTARSVDNHYLSLLTHAFRENADKPLFRPYLGKIDEWGLVTYGDFEKRLAVAQAHWKRTLADLKLDTLDIVGFW